MAEGQQYTTRGEHNINLRPEVLSDNYWLPVREST